MDSPAVQYLEVALDAAKKEQWKAAQLNAEEAAKYAAIADRTEGVG